MKLVVNRAAEPVAQLPEEDDPFEAFTSETAPPPEEGLEPWSRPHVTPRMARLVRRWAIALLSLILLAMLALIVVQQVRDGWLGVTPPTSEVTTDLAAAGNYEPLRAIASRAAPAGGGPAESLPVTAPVIISRQLPPWRGESYRLTGESSGAIDLIIDEQGRVESVSLRKSVHPQYDAPLLEAAKTWTYEPATRGAQPVKFQKTLVVLLNGR